MILADGLEFALRPEGWVHLTHDGQRLLRGPLGVMLYLAFVPFYWLVPGRWRAAFLVVTSIILTLVTLGHMFVLEYVVLAVVSLAIVYFGARPATRRIAIGFLIIVYAAILLRPQPGWLPPTETPEPFYFYLHWAGIAYLFLRTYHVLADVANGRYALPAARDLLAYFLFAPTLRMGPIQRFPDFAEQLHGRRLDRCRPGEAARRFVTALLRLGVMVLLLANFSPETLYARPGSLSDGELIIHLYVPAMCIFLWISAYADLSIGIGRLMGFAIPDNFHFCWFARNISDFWRRWHITLGLWLKDYLYLPLRQRGYHYTLCFTATFLFCGLWHGTYLSYVLWGLSQGFAMSLRRWWVNLWKQQAQGNSPLYRRLERVRLVNSPATAFAAWLLTFHYQVLTLDLFVDEQHAFRHLGPRLLALVGVG